MKVFNIDGQEYFISDFLDERIYVDEIDWIKGKEVKEVFVTDERRQHFVILFSDNSGIAIEHVGDDMSCITLHKFEEG